jgi:hypothetical protein
MPPFDFFSSFAFLAFILAAAYEYTVSVHSMSTQYQYIV